MLNIRNPALLRGHLFVHKFSLSAPGEYKLHVSVFRQQVIQVTCNLLTPSLKFRIEVYSCDVDNEFCLLAREKKLLHSWNTYPIIANITFHHLNHLRMAKLQAASQVFFGLILYFGPSETSHYNGAF